MKYTLSIIKLANYFAVKYADESFAQGQKEKLQSLKSDLEIYEQMESLSPREEKTLENLLREYKQIVMSYGTPEEIADYINNYGTITEQQQLAAAKRVKEFSTQPFTLPEEVNQRKLEEEQDLFNRRLQLMKEEKTQEEKDQRTIYILDSKDPDSLSLDELRELVDAKKRIKALKEKRRLLK